MSSNETAAYKIMQMLDVDYVLVIFGGVIGYSGDDINKFLWMVRIAEGEHPKDIKVTSRVLVGSMDHYYFGISIYFDRNLIISHHKVNSELMLEGHKPYLIA